MRFLVKRLLGASKKIETAGPEEGQPDRSGWKFELAYDPNHTFSWTGHLYGPNGGSSEFIMAKSEASARKKAKEYIDHADKKSKQVIKGNEL